MSQIRKGAFISYITVAFSIISGLFYTPYLIGKVGNGSYGIYTLVSTFLNYFLIDFGLGNAVAKYLSAYRVKNEREQAGKFISVIFKLFLMLAAVIGMILSVIYFFLESFFTGLTGTELIILKQMYIISGVSSVLLFVFIPLDGILTSYELFTELRAIELLRKIFVIVLSVMALRHSANVVNIVIVNAVAGFIMVGLKLFYVCRKTDLKVEWKHFDIKIIKTVGTFSLWLTIIMVAQRFIIPIAPTILGKFSNSTEISIFSIATTVEGYVFTFASCLNGLFLPRLTQLYIEHDNEEINRLFNKVGRLQVYIIGMILSAFIIFGQEFIMVWVGADFLKAYWVILLIMPTSVIVYAQEVANSILMIQDKLKYKAMCYSVGAVFSTVVSCVLSGRYGAVGAGVGVAACLWVSHVFMMNFIYTRITSLDIKNFFTDCYGRTLPCLAGSVVIGIWINRSAITDSVMLVGVKIAVFCFVLLIIYYFLAFKEDDKVMIKTMLNRLIKR